MLVSRRSPFAAPVIVHKAMLSSLSSPPTSLSRRRHLLRCITPHRLSRERPSLRAHPRPFSSQSLPRSVFLLHASRLLKMPPNPSDTENQQKPSKKTKKHMTPAELQAFIEASPKHKHVVKLYTPILVMGFISCAWVCIVVGTSVKFGELSSPPSIESD